MRNTWKMETSKDYTAWDLNCRSIVPHNKSRNRLEKIFRRKNRRKVKQVLDKYKEKQYNLLVRDKKGANNMTEKQINDIIDELTAVNAGLERLMREVQTEQNTVEELIGKFTAMLADADTEPEKEFYEFMDDETGELYVVRATDVVTAREILCEGNKKNVSFRDIISEEVVNAVGFDYWVQKEKRYVSIFF